MRIFFVAFIFTLLSVTKMGGGVINHNTTKQLTHDIDIEKDFNRLDSVVAQRAIYTQEKESAIKKYRQNYIFTTSIDRYNFNKHMLNEYMKFDSDSALAYAYRCRKIAYDEGLSNEKLLSTIDIAYIIALKGELMQAWEVLEQLPPISEMPQPAQTRLASTYLEYYLRLNIYANEANNAEQIQQIKAHCDSLIGYLPANSWMVDYYTAVVFKKGDKARLVNLIDNSPKPSIQAAMLYIALANVLQAEGDGLGHTHFLVLSAINDIKSANRDASSLIHISQSPYLNKSSKRASEYLKACTENAMRYNDQGRSLSLIKAGAEITKSYEERLTRYNTTMSIVCALLLIAILAIGLMMRVIIRRGRSRQQALDEMTAMNAHMQDIIDRDIKMKQALEENNLRLAQEINERNSRFMDVYLLVSRYAKDVDKFKRAVYNMLVGGKIDNARRELSSSSLNEKYLAEFYSQFDRAFLAMHPDFVERMNELLRPESAITLPTPGTLTPDLRIYALVSMGITDSVSIADFLQYSPQTVYNYRLRMRHNACIPEKSFASTVASLWK